MENIEKMKAQPKRGLWKPEEDLILRNYIETHGEGNWATVSKRSGLMRGGKSCRLRWKNYLRPNIKRGGMSKEEEDLIIRMHKLLGNRWSLIAGRLPGRTDNEVKNYWNTHLNKKSVLGKRKSMEEVDDSSNNQHTLSGDKETLLLQDSKQASQFPHTSSCDLQPVLISTTDQDHDHQRLILDLGDDENKIGGVSLKEDQMMGSSSSGRSVRDAGAWMDEATAQAQNEYDIVESDSVMMVNPNYYSNFVFDEHFPFTSYLDSFVLFEAFGTDHEVGIHSFLP